MSTERQKSPYVIAIIGAGLYGLSTLERIVANVPEYAAEREFHIHLIDPYLDRGSRTWLTDQPAELWMNSHAGEMTLFTDDSSNCAGPVRKGPTLHEWAAASGEVLSTDETLDRLVDAFSPHRYASRSLMGKYLGWFLGHVSENAPDNVRIHRHGKLAVDVTAHSGALRESESVWLAGESVPLACDRVVLAQGRPPVLPTPKQRELKKVLASYGGSYGPPGQASLAKAVHIRAGDSVLLRGLGLTFYDYLQLFTTVRGGKFRRTDDDSLVYEPSGEEPRIFATSRTGVPPCPVPWWPVTPHMTKCVVPGFTSREVFAELARSHDVEAALRESAVLMTSELMHFYYVELLTADPEHRLFDGDRFRHLFLNCAPGSREQEELVASGIPEEDRLDFGQMMDPLRDQRFGDLDSLQAWMRQYIARVTNRNLSKKHSCDLALRTSLAHLASAMVQAAGSHEAVQNSTFFRPAMGWVRSKLRFLVGGAPWPRQKELQALSRSGVVTFLGRDAQMSDDPGARTVRCASRTVPEAVDVTHVIEARHSPSSVESTTDPLHRELHRRGQLASRRPGAPASGVSGVPIVPELMAVTWHGRLISAGGSVSRTRYAVGADTSNPITTPGLPRARTDSDVFLLTDRVARHLLDSLSARQDAEEGARSI